jgi:hypothetical protein
MWCLAVCGQRLNPAIEGETGAVGPGIGTQIASTPLGERPFSAANSGDEGHHPTSQIPLASQGL